MKAHCSVFAQVLMAIFGIMATGAATGATISSVTLTSGAYQNNYSPTTDTLVFGADTNLVGGYISDLATFNFAGFGTYATAYTAASSPGGIPGGPVPVGDIAGGLYYHGSIQLVLELERH